MVRPTAPEESGAGAVAAELTSLALAQTAPDTAQRFPLECVLEALLAHGAPRAHLLGVARRFAARREEVDESRVVETLGVLPPVPAVGRVDGPGINLQPHNGESLTIALCTKRGITVCLSC